VSRPAGALLVAAAVGLFVVWSNSFIAIGYLLGADHAAARLDWRALTVARFLPAALICGAYLTAARWGESLELLRSRWRRLLVCGFLAVPGYNMALYYGQQHGVPAPVASLTTALVPLFVTLLAALFLSERLTVRRVAGFAVAATGMALVASAKQTSGAASYPLLVAVTALAPLCWSVFSVVSKPVTGRVSPIVWTYLAITLGGVMTLPLLGGGAGQRWAGLDARGWGALLYLSVPCTVVGFALWTWLLRHLPASTVGFTVFLNPPLTTISKYALALALPSTFAFTIRPREWLGGVLTLIGLAVAVVPHLRQGRLK